MIVCQCAGRKPKAVGSATVHRAEAIAGILSRAAQRRQAAFEIESRSMSDRTSIERVDVTLTASSVARAATAVPEARTAPRSRPDPNTPFRILCLGDFSALSSGDFVRLDRDDLDSALARLRPE